MESMVKKFQQRFRKAGDEMERWASLQSRLILQFRNAASIVDRLQVVYTINFYFFFFFLLIYVFGIIGVCSLLDGIRCFKMQIIMVY